MAAVEYAKGLEGVIAAESSICRIDGQNGKLYYMGYPIRQLVELCSFEEVTYLLLYGELPTREQLAIFERKMRTSRPIGAPIQSMIREFPRDSHPMELLQAVVSYLSGYVEHRIQHDAHCNCRITLHQVSQLATVVAALHRFRNGQEYVAPRDNLSHGANFLYMLHGDEPSELEGRIMDDCLTLHAEHSFNASTFTARVVASTLSTCYCSISAAIGALYGTLHGGANEKVMDMVDQIGDVANVDAWVNKALDEKRKIMGMGHRVYKAKDPRAIVVESYLEKLSTEKGDSRYYDMLKRIETVFRERMEEKGKPIYPNVDFFSGAVYRLLGIPSALFTPVFAIARAPGWLAHILEQRSDNRIFRPKALYVGHQERDVAPIEQRR
ncbi:MAG: citrate/2-methylcitrate synthase [Spirochaetaceae bacterium]|nr:MAG: citrate/2-methylcitrate synthase [Spirochaetaceae bacterium]